jgi:rRNA maturation RNase YbeY
MSAVSFTSLHSAFRLKNKKILADWIQKVVLAHHKFPLAISYIFCDDDYLLSLNKKYLKHSTLTDIITFNYNEGNYVSGDIFISTERVLENSATFKTTAEQELHRVMVHGVLHLLGFQDSTPGKKKQMRRKEDESLEMLRI